MHLKRSLSVLAVAIGSAGAADAVTLPAGNNYRTHGNTNVYSMPILANIYDINVGGGVGPGNPFYIASTPGAIKDLVVIYTGSSGTGVTTNAAGFDDAYGTPSGQGDYASIAGAVDVTNPGNKAGINNNDANTWDANLLALKGMLAGGTAQFMFNNNDTNKDQHLAVWAKLWLTGPGGAGDVYNGRYLYLSNEGLAYGFAVPLGGDATTYNPGDVLPSQGNFASTDYVLAGGQVCVNALGLTQVCDGTEAKKISHNLGANQVAYVADVPLLNTWLGTLFALGDGALSQYTMHLDLKLGCDPAAGWATCDSVKIDNGFEQLFLASSNSVIIDVPEPKGLALVGLALLLAVGAARRRAVGKA